MNSVTGLVLAIFLIGLLFFVQLVPVPTKEGFETYIVMPGWGGPGGWMPRWRHPWAWRRYYGPCPGPWCPYRSRWDW